MGFQAILGVGIGAFLQNSVLISQFEYEKQPRLISKATGLVSVDGDIPITFHCLLIVNLRPPRTVYILWLCRPHHRHLDRRVGLSERHPQGSQACRGSSGRPGCGCCELRWSSVRVGARGKALRLSGGRMLADRLASTQNLRAPVLAVYAKTLDDVFIIGVPFGIIAIAAALVIERKKYATKKAPPKAAEKAAEEGEAGVDSVKSQKA